MSESYVRSAFSVAALMIVVSISALISSSAIVTTDSIDDIVAAPDNLIRDFFHPGKSDNQVELNPAQELALQVVGMRGANTTWANAGGSENNDAIYEMAYDSQGNIIICGSIFVDSQFGTIEVFTEGLGDILVASLSPNGNAAHSSITSSANFLLGAHIAPDSKSGATLFTLECLSLPLEGV